MLTAEQVTGAFTTFSTSILPVISAGMVAALALMFVIMGPKKALKVIRGLFGTA